MVNRVRWVQKSLLRTWVSSRLLAEQELAILGVVGRMQPENPVDPTLRRESSVALDMIIRRKY